MAKRGRVSVLGIGAVLALALIAGVVYVGEVRAVDKAVADFFAKCAAATVASPQGCPQSSADTGTDFKWALVGDPSASLTLSINGSGNIHATGHYLMLDTFSGTFPNGVRHRVQGGPFEAVIEWNGGTMKVQRVTAAKAPRLAAPQAVTNPAIKSVVATAFKGCTAAPADGAPDCPQFDFAPGASNFRWSINGDPLTDTTVTFDSDRGVWQVLGNYSFHDSFDLASGRQEHDVNGTYFAYVIYDGSKVVAVYIRHI